MVNGRKLSCPSHPRGLGRRTSLPVRRTGPISPKLRALYRLSSQPQKLDELAQLHAMFWGQGMVGKVKIGLRSSKSFITTVGKAVGKLQLKIHIKPLTGILDLFFS